MIKKKKRKEQLCLCENAPAVHSFLDGQEHLPLSAANAVSWSIHCTQRILFTVRSENIIVVGMGLHSRRDRNLHLLNIGTSMPPQW